VEEESKVFADPNLFNTILRNLLSNAVKFSSAGGQVKISSRLINSGFIEFSVSDTGIGIAEDDIPRLFRIDGNTKTIGESTEKGTGFGLILCKDFVKKLGGEIEVESKLTKGSIFRFTLPVCQES
jgi:signal transduction histidine kinase